MAQHVADAGNLSPRNFRILRFDLIGEVAAGLRNDFNAALNDPLTLPIRLVSFKRYVR
jgi:hypothetical protein